MTVEITDETVQYIPVGTVRREWDGVRFAIWVKVAITRPALHDKERPVRLITEWLCIESNVTGWNGMRRSEDWIMQHTEVFGTVPGTQAWRGQES